MKVSAGKRVLMLVENDTYPDDDRVRCEASALTAAGYQVSVIAPAASGERRYEVLDGVCVRRFPRAPEANRFIGYIWEYFYSMSCIFVLSLVAWMREGFDVVHAHNPPDTLVFIALFYKLFGKEFVFDHHDLSPEMYRERFTDKRNPLVYNTLVAMEKLTCRAADHVIATNESYKRIEMERGGVPESRISIVRNGPDSNRLRIVEPDARLLATGKKIIGYVGEIGFQDGLDYLLRALRHLAYDLGRTDFYCIVIGKGNALSSMKQLATELKLDEFIWFTGFISTNDLNRYLSTAHLCVDPDPKNPFTDRSTMIKMTEYMAFAKPIVAFDLTEHRFTAGDAAIYVEPNNELAFAKAMVELMDDPDRRQAMGDVGRARIEAELAWEYSVPHLLEAYESLYRNSHSKKRWAFDPGRSNDGYLKNGAAQGARPAQ
jgi:glycosyltransferase involved in cell wall biosynthesis